MPLRREERTAVCPRGHSFDVARSGYLNLLQPQDRRSRQPGDSAEAVAARRRLHDRGVTAPLLEAMSAFLNPVRSDIVLDAGCGDGFYLGSMAGAAGFDAHGVDISIPAVQLRGAAISPVRMDRRQCRPLCALRGRARSRQSCRLPGA